MNISVVIPVYNAESTLNIVLKAILPELMDGDQVIVADDRSDDDTARIAKETDAVEYFLSNHSTGAAGTRNMGASRARNEWILFIDSDAVPPIGWRKLLEEKMSGEYQGIQAVYGKDAPGSGASTYYKNYYYYYTFVKRINSTCVQGCATYFFAVRRNIFNELGGFDEKISGASIEDAEFAARLTSAGGRILLVPEIMIYHLKQFSFSEFLRYEWMIMTAKALLLIQSLRSNEKVFSVSMAKPMEMLVVLLSGILIWLIPVGLLLWLFNNPLGPAAVGLGFFFVSLGHGFFWASMLKDGQMRGLKAAAVTFPDLLLLVPATLFSLWQIITKRA